MRLIAHLLLPLLALLLRPFLRTCCKGLFIVASEIIYSNFIDLNRTAGHSLDILYDHFVVGMLLIVLVALCAHIAS